MKLTAKNKELVAQIAHGFITTPIIGALAQEGHEVTPELLAGINHVVTTTDTTALQQIVGDALVEGLGDFKSLMKVNKFLAEPDTQRVLSVVQEINQLVSPVVNEIAQQILSDAAKQEGVVQEV